MCEAKRSERARVPNFRLCHMEQVSKPAVRRKKIESERKMKCKNTQKKKMNETGNLPCRLNKSEQIGGTRVKQKKTKTSTDIVNTQEKKIMPTL